MLQRHYIALLKAYINYTIRTDKGYKGYDLICMRIYICVIYRQGIRTRPKSILKSKMKTTFCKMPFCKMPFLDLNYYYKVMNNSDKTLELFRVFHFLKDTTTKSYSLKKLQDLLERRIDDTEKGSVTEQEYNDFIELFDEVISELKDSIKSLEELID